MSPSQKILELGIRANLGQFIVQTLLVFFVGMTIWLERNVVPVLAEEDFAIASSSVILSFVVSFGFVKAILNLIGGRPSESWGRKPILIAGWLAAVPIPLIIIFAPNWWWIVGANVLMGVNQGLAWSMTVTSKMDLVGERRRGLVMGINEFPGYTGVAVSVLVTGYLAASYGLRPAPFYFGLAMILAALGVALVFKLTTWQDRALFSCCQAGLLHKITDALVWVSFPLYFRSKGLDVGQIGLIVGVYGLTWGYFSSSPAP